jgi:hypothetical protein
MRLALAPCVEAFSPLARCKRAMMNALQCHAKAQAALEKASRSTDVQLRTAYAECAVHWAALKLSAEMHERMQFDLIAFTAH